MKYVRFVDPACPEATPLDSATNDAGRRVTAAINPNLSLAPTVSSFVVATGAVLESASYSVSERSSALLP